jgi:hypothetical protein
MEILIPRCLRTIPNKKLLDAFFEKNLTTSTRTNRQPTLFHDTLQALFQVYLFLNKAESAMADKRDR